VNERGSDRARPCQRDISQKLRLDVDVADTTDTILRLERGLNDLASILSLPAMWAGRDSSEVARTLLEALVRLLQLDFAYMRLEEPSDQIRAEWARLGDGSDGDAHTLGRALQPYVNRSATPHSVSNPLGGGNVSIAVFHLGLSNDVAVFVAGTERPDFPTNLERLLLQVATNQASIALQAASHLRQRQHAHEELERRVAERTRELTTLNNNLRHEVDERNRAEGTLKLAFEEIQRLKTLLQYENIALREEVEKTSMFEEIVGVSPALRSVLSLVSKVAPTDSTVLITGETGTGKELVARAIHKRSRRSTRAFVSVNCAATPSSLIASELFGHEKGAFTGASQRRLGRFELAEGGTIFLDEVGELPADTQVALLRVLQEREFERVGGSRTIRSDVRVIAATNRNLDAAIAEKTFRADLYYRLNVFPLAVPALRERREDIPLLFEYFLHRYAQRVGKNIGGMARTTMDLLQSYHWPGNIRELQNVVERAVIICDSDVLAVDDRWFATRSIGPTATQAAPLDSLATRERDAIEEALKASKSRVAGPFGAAARLGVPATTLESKIKALGIDKRRFKAS
jgi:transcriptional regulator with GAF, ATPase, and Fis domain